MILYIGHHSTFVQPLLTTCNGYRGFSSSDFTGTYCIYERNLLSSVCHTKKCTEAQNNGAFQDLYFT